MRFFKAFMMAATVVATMSMVGCGDDGGDDPKPEYSVTVTATTGGTAQASASKATAGTTVTLTATPAEGYTFSKWTVESGGATLSSATATPATFSMPEANVSIKAEFATATVTPDPDGELYAGSDLKGTISTKMRLDAATTYDLSDPLYIAAGGELNIPAGTKIEGSNGFDSFILVLQGGKINVRGTAANPVEMTAEGTNVAAGSWGGLVINGKAPLSGGGTAKTEIDNDYEYGGTDAADNSGSIEYLILRGTGAKNSADVEHNGLTLNAVGNGTKIENIFVIDGADDGIEFFGGSVNVTGLLVVNSDDDMFDFTYGYSGTLKNAYGVWEEGFSTAESDASGVEADGNFDGNYPTHTGQSDFTIENVTFDLRLAYNETTDDDFEMQNVLRIRRGAKATITNALVKGTGKVKNLINLSDSKGGANKTSSVSMTVDLDNAPDNEFVFCTAEQAKGGLLNDGTSAADYAGFDTSAAANAGCATSGFAWTDYEF